MRSEGEGQSVFVLIEASNTLWFLVLGFGKHLDRSSDSMMLQRRIGRAAMAEARFSSQRTTRWGFTPAQVSPPP
jgi:hypothetical protein